MYWQSGRAFKTAARVSLFVTLVHIHTHEHIHFTAFSFLASDSRHPAMTRGVSLAACKAALNRQKYLFWQTDRLSPSKTCMQLSQGLSYLFPTLWFDFSTHLSLSWLWTEFSLFLFLIMFNIAFFHSMIVMKLCLLLACGQKRCKQKTSSMPPTTKHHTDFGLYGLFIQSFALTFFSHENLFSIFVCLAFVFFLPWNTCSQLREVMVQRGEHPSTGKTQRSEAAKKWLL